MRDALQEFAVSADEQDEFARLCGDFNPIHIDPVFARRVVAGAPIAFGSLLILKALDAWVARHGGKFSLRRLRLTFDRAVRVGERVTVWGEVRDGRQQLTLIGAKGTAVSAEFTQAPNAGRGSVAGTTAPREAPHDLAIDAVEGQRGEISLVLAPDLAGRLFPQLVAAAPPVQVAALCAISRIVGMRCPGLHSIFLGLDIEFADPDGDVLSYRAEVPDRRFRRIRLAFTGAGVTGSADTMLRPSAVVQPGSHELRSLVRAGEFSGIGAVVVGGSRGIGEVVAKLLALGGADVCVTYHSGKGDADRVQADIVASGGRATTAQLDVLSTATVNGKAPPGTKSHLYYFATPRIQRSQPTDFSRAIFDDYCAYYVHGFTSLLRALPQESRADWRAFYPSTVFATDAPPAFQEYAAAKAAGEVAARAASRALRVPTTVVRLPMIQTDQTAGTAALSPMQAAELLVGEIRRLRDAP